MMTQSEKMCLLTRIVARLEREHGGVAPILEVEKIAERNGISNEFVSEMIQREKDKGRIYSPTSDGISRTTPTPIAVES